MSIIAPVTSTRMSLEKFRRLIDTFGSQAEFWPDELTGPMMQFMFENEDAASYRSAQYDAGHRQPLWSLDKWITTTPENASSIA
ncbi:MAG: hypothetical protein Alpg2KO_25700 [Alphaproteobacteria bacterium]